MLTLRRILVVALVLMSAVHSIQAREIKVRTRAKFDRAVNKSPLAAMLFYDGGKKQGRRMHKDERGAQKGGEGTAVAVQEIRSMSRSFTYKDGGLNFILVDATREDLQNLLNEYHITKLPTVALCRYGQMVRDSQDVVVKLSKFGRESTSIREFIEDHFGKELEERLEAKAEERARRAEAAAYYWYSSPYWYGGYGYYGWPSYGYSPRGWWW